MMSRPIHVHADTVEYHVCISIHSNKVTLYEDAFVDGAK
jgi:hypothetical protein